MANNPVVHSFAEKTVRKLATNVTSGTVCKHTIKGRNMTYVSTYRITGETAPTFAEMKKEGALMFENNNPEQEPITSSAAIDVYCYCNRQDNKETIGKLVVWT